MMGKGSKRRPQMVDDKTMAQNWDAAFPKIPKSWMIGEPSETKTVYQYMQPQKTGTNIVSLLLLCITFFASAGTVDLALFDRAVTEMAAQRTADSTAKVAPLPDLRAAERTGDAVTGRAIMVDPRSDAGIAIDSFDRDIAKLRSCIGANVLLKQLNKLSVQEQIDCCDWILINLHSDTTTVLRAVEKLALIQDIQVAKITIMMSQARDNTKSFLYRHIKSEQLKGDKLKAYILTIRGNRD